MSRQIHCAKLNKEMEGLDVPPYPGELGKRIYEQISKPAWQLWLAHQTMLINEYRLSMMDREARQFLTTEMEKFLLGAGSGKPAEFVPPERGKS